MHTREAHNSSGCDPVDSPCSVLPEATGASWQHSGVVLEEVPADGTSDRAGRFSAAWKHSGVGVCCPDLPLQTRTKSLWLLSDKRCQYHVWDIVFGEPWFVKFPPIFFLEEMACQGRCKLWSPCFPWTHQNGRTRDRRLSFMFQKEKTTGNKENLTG